MRSVKLMSETFLLSAFVYIHLNRLRVKYKLPYLGMGVLSQVRWRPLVNMYGVTSR